MAGMEVDDDESTEEEEEEEVCDSRGASSSIMAGIVTGMVHSEAQEVMMGLSSKSEEDLSAAFGRMRKLVQSHSGGQMLMEYVAASPECVELRNAFNAGPKARTAVPLLLLLVEMFRHPIGLRHGSFDDDEEGVDQKQKLAVRLGLDKFAQSVVQNKLSDIYSHLSSRQRNRENAVLRLLSAIVSRSKLLAKQVAAKFDFSLEALKKLARHPIRGKKLVENLKMTTRVAFIEFAMAFLVIGDAGLLRWILQKRVLYAGVLHGLAGDSDDTVVHVLSIFREKVLDEGSNIPQGIQVALFGDAALEQLQKITAREKDSEPAVLAQALLLALCTDPRHGICPSGTSLEDFQKVSGQFGGGAGRLLRLMVKLKATEVEAHRELVLAICKARPLLAAAYIDSFPYSLEPRVSTVWFSAMALVSNVVKMASEASPFDTFVKRGLPPPSAGSPLVESCFRRMWPQGLSRALFNRALLHEDQLVKHCCLNFLLEVLAALERLLSFIKAAYEGSGFAEDWSKLGTYIQDKARVVLPECQTLLLIQFSSEKQQARVGSKRKTSDLEPGTRKKLKAAESSPVTCANVVQIKLSDIWEGDECSDDDIESMLYVKLLDVISAFQKVVPLALRDINLDPLKFVPKDLHTLDLYQQRSLVSFLLSTAELLSSTGFYKSFKLLTRLVVSLKTVELRQKLYALLHRSLYSTGAFEANPYEASVWLRCLPGWGNGSLEAFDETVTTFLCDLVLNVGKNLYKYVDQAHSLLSKHITEETEFYDGIAKHDFGALVMCALDTYKRLSRPEAKSLKIWQKTAISIYVGSVLRSLLHSEVQPRSLALTITSMLEDYEIDICESTPLQSLYSDAMAVLEKTNNGVLSWLELRQPKSLQELMMLCRQESDHQSEVAVSFTRALYCVQPAELVLNFKELLEVHDSLLKGDMTALVFLLGAFPEVLSEAAAAAPEMFTEAAFFIAGDVKECKHDCACTLASLILKLRFEVLFEAACWNDGLLLTLPHFLDVLRKVLAHVSGDESILCGRLIFHSIMKLHSKDLNRQLGACFTLLKLLLTRDDSSETQQLVKEFFLHPLILDNFLKGNRTEEKNLAWNISKSTDFEEMTKTINFSMDSLQPVNYHVLRIVENMLPNTRSCIHEYTGDLIQQATELYKTELGESQSSRNMAPTMSVLSLSVLVPYARMESVTFLMKALRRILRQVQGVENYQLLTLFLACTGFRRLQQLTTMNSCWLDDYDGSLIDTLCSIIELALASPLGIADSCMLLGVRVLACAKFLVAVSTADILLRSLQKTSKEKAEVALLMVQENPMLLTSFGRLLASSTSQCALSNSLTFGETYQQQTRDISISKDELLLLLPVAQLFLEKFDTLDGCPRDTVLQVASIFGKLIAKRLGDWERNADLWAESSELGADGYEQCMISKFAKVLRSSSNFCSLSNKQKRNLLRMLLPKDERPLDTKLTGSDFQMLVNKLVAKACLLETLVLTQQSEGDLASDISAFTSYLNSALASIYKTSIAEEASMQFFEDRMLEIFCNAVETSILISPKDVYSSTRKLAKTLLRFRFGRPTAMEALQRVFMKLLEKASAEDAVAVMKLVTDVMDFVMAHSQFVQCLLRKTRSADVKGTALTDLPSILSLLVSPGDWDAKGKRVVDEADEVKLRVVKLLRLLHSFRLRFKDQLDGVDSKTTDKELLSLLLAAYGATTSLADQEIFCLMHEIETLEGEEFPGIAGMDYLWGEAALERRKEMAENEDEDTLQENMQETRKRRFKEDLVLDPKKCGLTVLHFPVKRDIWSLALDVKEESARCEHDIYDPAFILPFSMHALAAGCIDAEEFVRLGLLAIAFSSMSSASESLRKHGYELLATFTTHLEGCSHMKGKTEILSLLAFLKNSVTQPWERIPSIISLFAAEASCILMHPDSATYLNVNRLLLRSPSIDLQNIPFFQSMFTSGSSNERSERVWIFKLLLAGLVGSADAVLYRRHFVAEILTSFCKSSMADPSSLQWTFQILKRAAAIPSFAKHLVNNTGLLLWLASTAVEEHEGAVGSFADHHAAGLALQVIELLLSSRERHLVGEGIEEVVRVASILLRFLSRERWDALSRPCFQIIKSTLKLSQRKNKYRTSFSLSMETLHELFFKRNLCFDALECLMQSAPPPVRTKQDEETVCAIVKSTRTLLAQRDLDEDMQVVFLRWCSAAFLLGSLPSSEKPSFATWWSYFTYLNVKPGLEYSCPQLPRLLISMSSVPHATVPTVNMLLVFIARLPRGPGSQLYEVLKILLMELPFPEELSSSWRWSRSPRDVDMYEREVYRTLLTVLRQCYVHETEAMQQKMSRWRRSLSSCSIEDGEFARRLETLRERLCHVIEEGYQGENKKLDGPVPASLLNDGYFL